MSNLWQLPAFAPSRTMASPTLSQVAAANLPPELLARLPLSEVAAEANLKRIQAKRLPAIQLLQSHLRQATSAAIPRSQKLIRIRHIAGEYSQLFATETACASGCSHCCHVDVLVPRSEAQLMAKALNQSVSEPQAVVSLETAHLRTSFVGTPCTFLKEGKCSIYARRPLVCRTLVNLDSVSTLCELIPGAQVPVPYLNTVTLQSVFAKVTQAEDFADVREWFPVPLKPLQT